MEGEGKQDDGLVHTWEIWMPTRNNIDDISDFTQFVYKKFLGYDCSFTMLQANEERTEVNEEPLKDLPFDPSARVKIRYLDNPAVLTRAGESLHHNKEIAPGEVIERVGKDDPQVAMEQATQIKAEAGPVWDFARQEITAGNY